MWAHCSYPGAFWRLLRPLANTLLNVGDAPHHRSAAVNAQQAGGEAKGVAMSIVEAGNYRPALAVDNPGFWPLKEGKVFFSASFQDTVALDGHHLCPGMPLLQGYDLGITEDEV